MDSSEIKTNVQQRYAEIVSLSGNNKASSCCCSPAGVSNGCCGDSSTLQQSIVESDLGLSCGFPTQYANLQPGETVLDLGSGAGVDAFTAAMQVGERGEVIGVDFTPEMIDRAREIALKNGFLNVDFRQGDIENLPVESGSVDAVLSNCVINLVPDKQSVFREIFRVLKQDGRFCISDIVTDVEVPESLKNDLALWAECLSGAMQIDNYLNLITGAGFKNLKVHHLSEFENPGENNLHFLSITLEGRKE